MKPPEEVKREFVRQWVQKAEEDFHAAQILEGASAGCLYVIAFHAQQAAEKLLKAYLTWGEIEFPKTHDIGKLLDLLARVEPDLAGSLRRADLLTDYGVDIRYPSDMPLITTDAAREALELASKVREAILPLLRQHLGESQV